MIDFRSIHPERRPQEVGRLLFGKRVGFVFAHRLAFLERLHQRFAAGHAGGGQRLVLVRRVQRATHRQRQPTNDAVFCDFHKGCIGFFLNVPRRRK